MREKFYIECSCILLLDFITCMLCPCFKLLQQCMVSSMCASAVNPRLNHISLAFPIFFYCSCGNNTKGSDCV